MALKLILISTLALFAFAYADPTLESIINDARDGLINALEVALDTEGNNIKQNVNEFISKELGTGKQNIMQIVSHAAVDMLKTIADQFGADKRDEIAPLVNQARDGLIHTMQRALEEEAGDVKRNTNDFFDDEFKNMKTTLKRMLGEAAVTLANDYLSQYGVDLTVSLKSLSTDELKAIIEAAKNELIGALGASLSQEIANVQAKTEAFLADELQKMKESVKIQVENAAENMTDDIMDHLTDSGEKRKELVSLENTLKRLLANRIV